MVIWLAASSKYAWALEPRCLTFASPSPSPQRFMPNQSVIPIARQAPASLRLLGRSSRIPEDPQHIQLSTSPFMLFLDLLLVDLTITCAVSRLLSRAMYANNSRNMSTYL